LSAGRITLVLLFAAALGFSSYLIHERFFDWKPVYPSEQTRVVNDDGPLAERVIVVVVDGCRLDRLREARKP